MKVYFQKKIWYFLSVVMLFCALITGTLCNYMDMQIVSDTFLKIAFCFLLVGSISSILEKNYFGYSFFYCCFFIIAALFWDLSFFKYSLKLEAINMTNAIFGIIALNGSMLIWIYNVLHAPKIKGDKLKIKRYIPLGILCLAYAILFSFNYSVWFIIDSNTYYLSIANNAGTWGFSFSNLEAFLMGGHTSYAYSVLLTIGELIAPQFGYGQRTINLFMSIVTIIAFYKITERIWGEKNYLREIFLTVLFAFAPLFYGISYLQSTDFPLLCFGVVFFFASFYNLQMLKFLMVICVCFSKEIGIFVLAGAYFAEFLMKCMEMKKHKFLWYLKELFSKKRLLIYSPVFLYAFLLLFGSGGWINNFRQIFVKDNSLIEIPEQTYTWWHYPIYKFYECFFMNFSWIIWILFFIMIITVLRYCTVKRIRINTYLKKKLKPYIQYYTPILVTYVFFLIIGIAYLTFVHYRYIQLGHMFFVLCFGIIIDLIPGESIKKEILLLPICLVMFIECFITIDPIKPYFFDMVNVGEKYIPSTRQYWYITVDEESGAGYYWEAEDEVMAAHHLAEGTEYNREIINLQRLLEKTFKDIEYSEDKLIILDNFAGWMEYTCGQLFGVMDSSGWFWDSKYSTVVRYDTGIPINFASDDISVKEYKKQYKEIYYLDFPFNEYYQNNILEENATIKSIDEKIRGWKITVHQLK